MVCKNVHTRGMIINVLSSDTGQMSFCPFWHFTHNCLGVKVACRCAWCHIFADQWYFYFYLFMKTFTNIDWLPQRLLVCIINLLNVYTLLMRCHLNTCSKCGHIFLLNTFLLKKDVIASYFCSSNFFEILNYCQASTESINLRDY